MSSPLRTLIVDDESLARSRLRTLLGDCGAPGATVTAEAADGEQALRLLHQDGGFDLLLVDIHMPGIDGITLVRTVRNMAHPPAVVFVTAHTSHAVTAFELEAVDYLTKPVRVQRLEQALQKAERFLKERRGQVAEGQDILLIQDRGRAERVPMSEVLYLKSELKYLTVRTALRSHILDGSLADFEERYPKRFVRVHRNALVARDAIRALEKYEGGEDAEGWVLRLHGVSEPVLVSRRQLAAVRDALKEG